MRQLATIRRIDTVEDIPDADKIQVATLVDLGWECVIKKDEFKSGDLVIYFEVDSILPEREEFEFLRDVKFRIKTRKFRKQVSQGYINSLDVLPNGFNVAEGVDVTEVLGVKKHDPQLQAEKSMGVQMPKSKALKFLMKYAIVRWVYFKFNSKVRMSWPDWCVKTDEDRIQVCAKKLMANYDKTWYITEKLDGSSMTAFIHCVKRWGLPKWVFGVCSRNIWLKTPDNSNYWKVAKKYDLEKKLLSLKRDFYLQGECLNTNIQGNKYNVTEPDFYVFNAVQEETRLSVAVMITFCRHLGLKHVPVVDDNFIPSEVFGENLDTRDIVKKLVEMSKGESKLHKTKREGLVFRLIENPNISFKVINPDFLLKHGE